MFLLAINAEGVFINLFLYLFIYYYHLHSFMKGLEKHLILLSLHKELVNGVCLRKRLEILKSIPKMQCSYIFQAGFRCKPLLSAKVGI